LEVARRLVGEKVLRGHKRGPKKAEAAVAPVSIFKKQRLKKSWTFSINAILTRMEYMIGNNLAYVHVKSALIGGVEALVTKEAMAGEKPDAESDPSARQHDREIARLSKKNDVVMFFGKVAHLQFDSTSLPTGGQYLSVGAVTWVDGEPFNTQMGMIRMIDGGGVGGKYTVSSAESYTFYVMGKVVEYKISPGQIAFIVVDSCTTNVGSKGGVVVKMKERAVVLGCDSTDACMFILHCEAHIVHNSVSTGIVKGFGEDLIKQRQGTNSPVVFFLEAVAAKVRTDFANLLPYFDSKVPMCPKCIQTRWNTYSATAAWLVAYHKQLCGALQKRFTLKGHGVNLYWANVAVALQDPKMMLQVTLLAEVGNQYTTWVFNWLEKNGSFHAAKVHTFLKTSAVKFTNWLSFPEENFEATYALGDRYRKEGCTDEACTVANVTEMVLSFIVEFSNYFNKRNAFWYDVPYVFAALGNDKLGQETAQELLKKVPERIDQNSLWATFGLFTNPELKAAVEEYAETGKRPEVLQEWWDNIFGCLPITNARMETSLKVLKQLKNSASAYSPETIEATAKIYMDRVWDRYNMTDEDLRILREEMRAEFVTEVSRRAAVRKSRASTQLENIDASLSRKRRLETDYGVDLEWQSRCITHQEAGLRKQDARRTSKGLLKELKKVVVEILSMSKSLGVTIGSVREAMKDKPDPRKSGQPWSAKKTMKFSELLEDIIAWQESNFTTSDHPTQSSGIPLPTQATHPSSLPPPPPPPSQPPSLPPLPLLSTPSTSLMDMMIDAMGS
jgi:hypothetical protein